MSELVTLTFPNINQAKATVSTVRHLTRTRLVAVEDACYLAKDAEGRVKVVPAFPTIGGSATAGAFLGGLLGYALGSYFPLRFADAVGAAGFQPGAVSFAGALFGAVIGVVIGAVAAALARQRSHRGIDRTFVHQLGAGLRPSTSAFVALLAGSAADVVVPELSRLDGTTVRTPVPEGTAPPVPQEVQTHGNAAESGDDYTTGMGHDVPAGAP